MHSINPKSPMNRPIPEVLDHQSLKGILFLSFFGTLITAKCSASEAARLYYQFSIDSGIFIWLPSLILGGLVCLLYIAGPGSAFHPYWRSKQFLLPAAMIWVTVAFSIVLQLPSVVVPAMISGVLAMASFTLGHFYRLIPVKFLSAIWVFVALICLFSSNTKAYGLLAAFLVIAGAVPCGIAYLKMGKTTRDR